MTVKFRSVSDVLVTLTILAIVSGVVFVTAGGGPGKTTERRSVESSIVLSAGHRVPAATVGAMAAPPTQETIELFRVNCATCHGVTGEGNGPAAYLLFPKPRDFTAGVFRFKSTPNVEEPTLADLQRTIHLGIPRTGMPAFAGVLTEEEITSLAQYVLTFSRNGWPDTPPTPITIPPQPEFNAGLVEQGNKVFAKMGCAQCHGETGHGDGPSSYTLVDANGYPLPPADFTTGVFKAGSNPSDLYRTILIGVPGTPMPSFQAAIDANIKIEGVDPNTDMVWALVAYLESLAQPREREGIHSGAVLTAQPVSTETMFDNPFDKGWDVIPSTAVSIQPLWQRKVAPRAIEVRIARNRGQLAFCLDWPDPTMNGPETLHAATDGAGIMFSLTPQVPTLTMGLRTNDKDEFLVNIWHWTASRQIDANEHRRHDLATIETGEPSDIYMFKKGDPTAGPLTEHNKTFISGWYAGNPRSDPALISNPILEADAAGFGTLTLQPAGQQSVGGRGVWSNGHWRVVFVRELARTDDGDVDLTTTRRIPLAFAIWDGAASDRNGTKLISGWHWLEVGN